MKYKSIWTLLLVILISCKEKSTEYRQFNGAQLNAFDTGIELIDQPIQNNKERASLAAVSIYYGYPIKYENGNLFLPDSCFDDLELLWNFTTKSKNKEWMEEHLIP